MEMQWRGQEGRGRATAVLEFGSSASVKCGTEAAVQHQVDVPPSRSNTITLMGRQFTTVKCALMQSCAPKLR